jgi:glycosyltransferase involved in cell wall biosynthesis
MRDVAHLVMIGGGPLRGEAVAILQAAGPGMHACLPGECRDVPEILRGLYCFVLPSLAEGISNTILEAMSSGLPVVATAVGGNGELVVNGRTGELVQAGDPGATADRIGHFLGEPDMARAAGSLGRTWVEESFSLDSMVDSYMRIYDDVAGVPRSRYTPESRNVAI